MKPLTPEALVTGLTLASDPDISPDGEFILYTVADRDRTEVWVRRVDGGQPRRLWDGSPASGARWSPDGTSVAFIADDDNGAAIFVTPVESPGEAREVTRHAQDIDDLTWSPDGAHIAYTTLYDPDNPDEISKPPNAAPAVRVTERIDYKEDGRGFVGDRRTHVFLAGVEGGVRRRITEELFDHRSPQWSPDGRRIAVHRTLSDRGASHLILTDPETRETQIVGPKEGRLEQFAWSQTGDRIFFAADPDHSLQADYFIYEVASKRTRRLTHDLQSEPDAHPTNPVWLDDRYVLVHSFRAGASTLERIDSQTGIVTLVKKFQARKSGMAVDLARGTVVQGLSSFTSIGEIAVYHLETDSEGEITTQNHSLLTERPAATWERFEVQSGELLIESWLLLPPDFDSTRKYPVILDVHGGPTAHYGYGFMAHQQCLATHGFLVVFANPRGSSSYGREFARRNIRDWGGGDYEDLMAVVDAVLERPYADSERTGIFGISYGGYMTAWAISQTDRFKAAVCGEPIFDLESDYGTSDVAYNGLEHFGGGPPHSERGWYADHSPSTYAHQIRTPTFLFHGEADQRCPIGQSEQMFVALKKAGCEVQYARYPNGSHMFFAWGLPEHRVDFLTRTLSWFKAYLGEPA